MDTYSSQIHRMEIKAAITMSWEEEWIDSNRLMDVEFPLGDENVLKLDRDSGRPMLWNVLKWW